MTENEFQKMVLDAFQYDRNIKLWKVNVGADTRTDKNGKKRIIRYGQPGQCDLEGIVKEYHCPKCHRKQEGVYLGIELKVGKNNPTKLQEDWIDMIHRYHGIAFVLRPEPDDPMRLARRVTNTIMSMLCVRCSEMQRHAREFIAKRKGGNNE